MNSAIRRAGDLPASIREALEALLGRPLLEDETVSVQTFPTHEAPAGDVRDEAWRRLLDRTDETAARVRNLPDEELDALIDEATRHARMHRHNVSGQDF